MASPRITYNSKNIDFGTGPYRLQYDYPGIALVNMSVSRIAEVLNVSPDVAISLAFRGFQNANTTHATLKRNLYQFWEWARQGKAWTFARDSSKTANTTLLSGASAGDTTLTVSSITGLSSGDQCVLRSATQMEIIKINGAPSGSTVTLTESLNASFASGTRFRHEQYWPARLMDTRKHIVQEVPTLTFDVEMMFTEDMNS